MAARPRMARLYVGATGGLKRACSSQQASARRFGKICRRRRRDPAPLPFALSSLNDAGVTWTRLCLLSRTLLFPMVRRATYRAAPGGRKGGEGRRDAWRVDETGTWSVFGQGIPALSVAMRSVREHVSRASACAVLRSAFLLDRWVRLSMGRLSSGETRRTPHLGGLSTTSTANVLHAIYRLCCSCQSLVPAVNPPVPLAAQHQQLNDRPMLDLSHQRTERGAQKKKLYRVAAPSSSRPRPISTVPWPRAKRPRSCPSTGAGPAAIVDPGPL
ncbi:uncharacterized protein J3D65DRAFT_59047 [Phyllosticta citribraziliensis]|uniref:Uncharacterized protein n=1 Tax=Phyllosticta citribraziliensis TaxID=989973 RepID=A0ABR1LEE9_9PEZI